MSKLVFLFVAFLALFASANAQAASSSMPPASSSMPPASSSIPMSPSSSVSNSLSSSVSSSFSNSVSSSFSSSVSNSFSSSVSNSFSSSVSNSWSSSVSNSWSTSVSTSLSTSQTVTMTPSQTATPTSSETPTGTDTMSVTNTMTNTITNTLTATVSASWSSSLSAPASITPSITPAPPPTNLVQVTAGCGNGRKIICVSWARPSGVPALNYYVAITGVVSGARQAMNFTDGETFAMFMDLNPATAYTVTVQTLFMGTLSSPATLNVMTAAPNPKQMPSLGITGFACRAVPNPNMKKKRNVVCNWTNGSSPYTSMNLRIKCTGKAGSAFDGKRKNVRRVVKAGQSSHTETGFFMNARCKVISNPAYASGPGRRIVQIIEIN